MKIRFYLALAAAALVMTNCSQDEELVQVKQPTKGFTATIEGASRSNATEAGVFTWTTGDKISVWNGSTFDVYANSTDDVNTFNPQGNADIADAADYAIYPAGTHSIAQNGAVTINLPASYAHGSTNAPMLANITDGSTTLAFKHLGGLMRFVVNNVPVGASSFVFTTTNNILTGSYNVIDGQIYQNGEGVVSNTNNNVTITFTELTAEAESMVFFVPLPVGTYGNYTVAIKGTNVDLSHPSTGITNTIGRCTMLLMPEFTCTPNGLEKAPTAVIPVTGEDVDLSGIQSITIGTGTQSDELGIDYTPSEGNATLNIKDDSNETESQDSKGKIKINPQGSEAIESLNLNTPSLTAELGTGKYGKVEALTAKQTLIIGDGATVDNLVVKGGNARVQGTVSSISRAEGNTDEVTYVIYEEGALIPETLEENIVAVSAAEYDLIVAIANGGTVTLESDVTLHKALTISNDVTLNLNGKTLTGNVDGYLFESSGNLTISGGDIVNTGGAVKTTDGTLTMTDCNVTVTGNKRRNAVYIQNITNAVITGGCYKATGTLAEGEATDWYGIGIVDGTVTLNTTVEGTFNGGVTLAPDGTRPNVTITGGSYSGQMYHGLNMNGGDLTLNGEMEFDGKGGDIRVYTLTGTINGKSFGEYGNQTYTLSELIAIIGSTTEETTVATPESLVAAVATGGKVKLGMNMTLNEALNISNDVILNLNGKTLTGNVDGYLFESSGNLTISGGDIVNTGGAVKTTDGTLTMTDCNVTVTGNKRRNAVYIQNITNAVITGGCYKATGTLAEGEATDWYGIGIVDGTVTLNTTVEGTFNGGVTLAPDGTRPNVTITGGSYSGQMYHGLNMNGGDLILTEDAEMEFNGNGGDIRIYTKTGTVNDVVFGFTLEGKKSYTLEELMAVIAEKKASAE